MGSARELWDRVKTRFTGDSSDESVNVLGHTLHLRRGSFRHTPDYDDAWFLACAMRARVIFDVGANVGYDAVLALAFSETEVVALIEANPKALSVAVHNLEMNGLANRARFVPGFASDVGGDSVTFWTTGVGEAGSMFPQHARTAAAHGKAIRIATTTLDAIGAALAVQPDFIKIDVEGAEAKVLDGSRVIAARREARFLVEMHSNPALSMLTNAKAVLSWCGKAGHAAWLLKERARVEVAERIEHRGRCHLLLQPKEWPFPAWLENIEQGAPILSAFPPGSVPDVR